MRFLSLMLFDVEALRMRHLHCSEMLNNSVACKKILEETSEIV